AAQLTLLELPNLLEMIAWSLGRRAAERVVELAGQVETLVANLGRPQALAQWSHARYLAETAAIERMTERGDLPAAYAAIQKLLAKGLAAGEAAYPGAAYDISYAHWV